MAIPGHQPIRNADHNIRATKSLESGAARQGSRGLADRVRSLLETGGITLNRASAESERLYRAGSPFRIPHTLYSSLDASPVFRPSLHQVAALSRISGYTFEDWLLALDFNLQQLAAAASLLPARRTRIIDPGFDVYAYVVPELVLPENSPAAVLPVSELLKRSKTVAMRLPPDRPLRPVFALLGSEDAFAYPELLPGSIVRVDSRNLPDIKETARQGQPPLLLIEQGSGYWCGRFEVLDSGTVRVAAAEMAYSQALLAIPEEARIVGRVDMEFRWPLRHQAPVVPPELATFRQPQAFTVQRSLRALLWQARANAGLTLAETSEMSRRMAGFLHDEQYAISASTLADFEAGGHPPRHLQKVLTLCVIYGIPVRDFLTAADIPQESLGQTAAPKSLVGKWARIQLSPIAPDTSANTSPGDLNDQVPWFLRDCLPELSGIQQPSLRDFFWIGGNHPFLPRSMSGSRVALVNRRLKKPVREPGVPGWRQPAYVLWHRGIGYLCGCCSTEKKMLVLYPESGTGGPQPIRRDDVEVVGQIVGLARYID